MAAMGVVRACAPPAAVGASSAAPSSSRRDAAQTKRSSRTARVLVLGGTGRVGGSTATALSKLRPDLSILVGGRNREKGESLATKLGAQSEFVQVDTRNTSVLEKALQDAIDTLPFSEQTAYIDVCDDTDYSWRAKGFHEQAKAAGVPAITTAGIYPGVSNVMAAELVHAARSENGEPERLRLEFLTSLLTRSHLVFFYYTAGTGGAGPTILATSFLLLGEDVIAYNKGEEIKLKPYSGALGIDFGKGVRKKNVYLLNLPEVKSAFKILGVPLLVPSLVPLLFSGIGECRLSQTFYLLYEFLRDRNKVQKLVESVDPLVRAIDGIAGERVSIRVDLECSNGRNTIGLFTHRKQSVSVGFATAAFALAVLEGNTQPGVWFPEEPEGIAMEARKLLLERASEGTSNFVMNKWFLFRQP
nr:unnamed protein product [Digitaria exilis]